MPLAGLEPTVLAIKLLHAYAVVLTATGTGGKVKLCV